MNKLDGNFETLTNDILKTSYKIIKDVEKATPKCRANNSTLALFQIATMERFNHEFREHISYLEYWRCGNIFLAEEKILKLLHFAQNHKGRGAIDRIVNIGNMEAVEIMVGELYMAITKLRYETDIEAHWERAYELMLEISEYHKGKTSVLHAMDVYRTYLQEVERGCSRHAKDTYQSHVMEIIMHEAILHRFTAITPAYMKLLNLFYGVEV